MAARCCIATLLCILALLLAPVRASAVDLRADPSILGQVRDGDGYFPGSTEVPIELYGDFGLSGLPHGTTFDTYFRLEDDFANLDNSETDFFSGVIRRPVGAAGTGRPARPPDRRRIAGRPLGRRLGSGARRPRPDAVLAHRLRRPAALLGADLQLAEPLAGRADLRRQRARGAVPRRRAGARLPAAEPAGQGADAAAHAERHARVREAARPAEPVRQLRLRRRSRQHRPRARRRAELRLEAAAC